MEGMGRKIIRLLGLNWDPKREKEKLELIEKAFANTPPITEHETKGDG